MLRITSYQIRRLNKLKAFVLMLSITFSFGSTLAAQTNRPEHADPSPIKTVYIVPTSHYDFGFVEPPDAVRERAARHIDEVIRVAEANPDFRWTIESVWQVNEWLKRAKASTSVLPKDQFKIDRLVRLIKSGQVTLSTTWGSMHTEFMGTEELNRYIYDYTTLKRNYGINSDLAVIDDVPGQPMSLPSVLADSGVKYFMTGVNQGLLGGTTLAPGKVPFYWEGKDGGKVLTWISEGVRGGYPEGLTDFYLDPFTRDPYTGLTPYKMFNPDAPAKTELQIMEEGVGILEKRYADAGYKYDAVMTMYAHDFVEPTNVINLMKAVKLWNDHHKSPVLKIATPPEFFHYMEGKYASQIETFHGEFTGLWSESKTHSPLISELARYAHDNTPAADTLWSAIAATRGIPQPIGNMNMLYDLMMTYDEHSGAGNTGWPKLNLLDSLEEQNRQYVGYMKRAQSQVDYLMDNGLSVLAESTNGELPKKRAANVWPLIVYNALSWTRTDLVTVKPPSADVHITSIRDSNGKAVSFDIDAGGNALFIAHDVPSLGYVSFEVETAAGAPTSSLKNQAKTLTTQSKRFRITMNADGTVQSLIDSATGRELVNRNGALHFNYLLRSQGNDPVALPYSAGVEVSTRRGNLLTEITVSRPQSSFPATIITLYDDLDRVDIHNEIDGAKLPFAGGKAFHDSYFFAFPFALEPASLKVMSEGQRGFVSFPEDTMPGARQDAAASQHVMGLSDAKGSVMLAHRQSFYFVFSSFLKTKPSAPGAPAEFPAMLTGKWPLTEATLYAKAMRRGNQSDTNDLGMTNLKTVEPGLGMAYAFDYSISASSAVFDPVAASRFGWSFNMPLRTAYTVGVPTKTTNSFFSVDQPNVQIATVKAERPAPDTGMVTSVPLTAQVTTKFVVRLQEIAGRPTTVRLTMPAKVKSADILNLTEDRVVQSSLPITPITVTLKPYQTVTVRVEIEGAK